VRQGEVGLYFLDAGRLNEAILIKLMGEHQRRESQRQYGKNRTCRKQLRSRAPAQASYLIFCYAMFSFILLFQSSQEKIIELVA
jgi:hypothetical protein